MKTIVLTAFLSLVAGTVCNAQIPETMLDSSFGADKNGKLVLLEEGSKVSSQLYKIVLQSNGNIFAGA